jgi:glucose/arabinose dehydrogenase
MLPAPATVRGTWKRIRACNICMPPDTHAQFRRINLDGSGMEVVARGIRMTVGFDWHLVTKELWFTENQRD